MKKLRYLSMFALLCFASACSSVTPSSSSSSSLNPIVETLSKGLSEEAPWYRGSNERFNKGRRSYSVGFEHIAITVTDFSSFVATSFSLEEKFNKPADNYYFSGGPRGSLLYQPEVEELQILFEDKPYKLPEFKLNTNLLSESLLARLEPLTHGTLPLEWSTGTQAVRDDVMPYVERTIALDGGVAEALMERIGFTPDKNGKYRVRTWRKQYVFQKDMNLSYSCTTSYYYEGEWGPSGIEEWYRRTAPTTEQLVDDDAPSYTGPFLTNQKEFFFEPLFDFSPLLSSHLGPIVPAGFRLSAAISEDALVCPEGDFPPFHPSTKGDFFGLSKNGEPITYQNFMDVLPRILP